MSKISKAACIGAGVIGAGWAARLAWNGIDVNMYDPHPEAPRRLNEVMANADRAMSKLTIAPFPPKGKVTFCSTMDQAVSEAQFIQESAPEREDVKISILAEIEKYAPADALIGSSTSGLLPTRLQSDMKHPRRFLVCHPFQPVYLLPLVELVGGELTAPECIENAKELFKSIGMKPLHVRKEIDAFLADRLMEAMWREALWLLHDDVATAEELDDAVIYGCGLRWASMGSFLTFRIAGGEPGMRHFMSQFGPALKWPWTKLMDTPELDEALLDKIVAQSDAQAKGIDVRELERKRDDCLIAVQQALKAQDYAAGKVLAEHEERLVQTAKANAAQDGQLDITQPLQLYQTEVQPEWVDYNGHMTESRYLQVFGDSSDALYRYLGIDQAYLEEQGSYYTVETHLMHIREVAGGEPIYSTTQILGCDEKRLHLFHRIHHASTDELLASCEQMMLHVGAASGRASAAAPWMQDKINHLFDAQRNLDKPESSGRRIALNHRQQGQ